MQDTLVELNKKVRRLGMLYVVWILTGLYSLIYLPPRTIVQGDAAATAQKMVANEFIFRTGIVNSLISGTIWIFIALILYGLFKNVSEKQAKLLVALVLVQIPVMFIVEAFSLTSLMIFKGEMLKTINTTDRQEIAILFIDINSHLSSVLETFWGLWLFPFGQLVYQSGFIPRILGVFLVLNGITLIIHSFTTILFPGYQEIVKTISIPFWVLGEVVIALWMLIMGVRSPGRKFF